MDLKIFPQHLMGTVTVPSSKSYTHRALIAAGLAGGGAVINPLIAEDTTATLDVLKRLGVRFTVNPDRILFYAGRQIPQRMYYAGESASTLRFLLPVIAAFISGFSFQGSRRLLKRVFTEDLTALAGLDFNLASDRLTVRGRLTGTVFRLTGLRTTQLLSGMILALPLLSNARLVLSDTDIFDPYVAMTLEVGRHFGMKYDLTADSVALAGLGGYQPANFTVEGDFSHAANWLAAAYLNPGLKVAGLNRNSRQGDKSFIDFLEKLGLKFLYQNGTYCFQSGKLRGGIVDIGKTPDLGPILAALASVGTDRVIIKSAGRLRRKESNRMTVIAAAVNALGGRIEIAADSIIVDGCGLLPGGVAVSGAGDHRIVMALAAIGSRIRQPYVIKGAASVNKSYPDFFNDFKNAGGKAIKYENTEC